MPADLKYLREHYSSLSDDALRAIDRDDLVDAARQCYDDEIKQRVLASRLREQPADEEPDVPEVHDPDDSDHPNWLEDATEVYSRVDRAGNPAADDLADARDALEAAGIPCHLELSEIPEDAPSALPPPTHVWRLLVPGNLSLSATNVLERDIFNQEFEQTCSAYLETLSDTEFRRMNLEEVFCGLFDRVERLKNAFALEKTRRNL